MKTKIQKTPEIEYYTYIKQWLPYVCVDASRYNFALAEVEVNYVEYLIDEWKSNREDVQYWIPGTELKRISRDIDLQFIWEIFAAIPKNMALNDLTIDSEFYIDGNPNICKDVDTQFIKESEFEVIAFDSSFFIIQCDNLEIHKKFKEIYSNAKAVNNDL